MTDQYRGTGRPPGPFGISPVQPRGPLWQKQSSPPPPNATKAVKKTIMPLPYDSGSATSKDVHAVTLPLFNASKQAPAFDDIEQAPDLANCPVSSMLAALAFTPAGRNLLKKRVVETSAITLTQFPGLDSSELVNPPPGMTITSSRYFTVSLPRGAQVVSDVLYTNDADRDWSPLYLRDPDRKCIWGSIIEKALALQLGSYKDLDTNTITANEYWEKIVGIKPGGFEIDARTEFKTITDAAKNSTRVSSIAASKDKSVVKHVSGHHGFAMLGMQGPQSIKLYDPALAKTVVLSVKEFRHDFKAILFQK